jgi:hypothetical protein
MQCLHARPEELDFELAIGDGLRLPDKLVQPLFGDGPVALLVNVCPMSRVGRLPIDQHAKFHRRSNCGLLHRSMLSFNYHIRAQQE